jgi:hypothetical protein
VLGAAARQPAHGQKRGAQFEFSGKLIGERVGNLIIIEPSA